MSGERFSRRLLESLRLPPAAGIPGKCPPLPQPMWIQGFIPRRIPREWGKQLGKLARKDPQGGNGRRNPVGAAASPSLECARAKSPVGQDFSWGNKTWIFGFSGAKIPAVFPASGIQPGWAGWIPWAQPRSRGRNAIPASPRAQGCGSRVQPAAGAGKTLEKGSFSAAGREIPPGRAAGRQGKLHPGR